MTRIMVIDDEELLGDSLKNLLIKRGYDTESFTNPVAAMNVLQKQAFDIVLTDFKMPNVDGLEMIDRIRELRPKAKIILMTAFASIPMAVEAMKRGAGEYIAKPFEIEELELKLKELGGKRKTRAKGKLPSGFELLGESPAMRKLRSEIRKIGKANATVLIRGESGVGKELVARQLHFHSHRAHEPFLAINMAAIPETLMESELFGYKKGGFTGADTDYLGKFAASNQGTLFMDEISEMPLNFQAKLLRVLQDFMILPIGSNEPIQVDCRVLAATNQDLFGMCQAGGFREDLYYRLNTLEISVPPLRDRLEDLPILVQHFLEKHSTEETKVDQEYLGILAAYHWPGNVRELENIVHRCVILGESQELDKFDLPQQISGLTPRKDTPLSDIAFRQLREGKSLSDLEREIILKAISESDGNKTSAAKILKITRRKLYSRLEKHGIEI
jgi:DNA-binding NtrC family response regulator